MEPRKIGDQLVGHRWRHRIEGVRPIEGEDFNRVTLFDGDRREFVHVVRSQRHRSSPGQQDVTGWCGWPVVLLRPLYPRAPQSACETGYTIS